MGCVCVTVADDRFCVLVVVVEMFMVIADYYGSESGTTGCPIVLRHTHERNETHPKI